MVHITLLFMVLQPFNLEELYNKATTSLAKFQAVKDSAVQQFIDFGKDPLFADTVMSFLVSKFDTKASIERHTLKDIFKGIGSSSIPGIAYKIDYRGSDAEARSLKQSLWVLGEIGGEEIIEVVSRFIEDDQWSIRSGAFTALGKAKSKKALPYILKGIDDTISVVRKSAYYALSQIAEDSELPFLLKGLDDEFYGVRYAASLGLQKIGKTAVRPLLKAFGINRLKDYFIVVTLKELNVIEELKQLAKSELPAVRFEVYQSVDDKIFLKDVIKKETHPLLREILESGIE